MDIGPTYLYNRTKLAQVLFVRHLVKLLFSFRSMTRHDGTVYINATHPDGVETDQQKQAEEAYGTNVNGQYIVPDKKVTAPSSHAQDEELQGSYGY
jgi:WW domain-containing oxidoreductase